MPLLVFSCSSGRDLHEIDARILGLVDRYGLPSMGAVVVRHGERVYLNALGLRSPCRTGGLRGVAPSAGRVHAPLADLEAFMRSVEHGEEVLITRRNRVVAKLIPVEMQAEKVDWPDFLARAKSILQHPEGEPASRIVMGDREETT
jgi:prevent-host-death family protein